MLLASPAFSRDHRALNGTWTLDPVKTDYNGQPVLQTGTVTINEREGNITVSRNFVYKGATETFFYKDMADSENSATIKSGDTKSKAKWDHDVLKVTTTQGGSTTFETYSLAGDGTMLVSVQRTDRPLLRLVFRRSN